MSKDFSHKMARVERSPLAVAARFYASINWRKAEKETPKVVNTLRSMMTL
jgi:hypothetical protein